MTVRVRKLAKARTSVAVTVEAGRDLTMTEETEETADFALLCIVFGLVLTPR